MSDKEEKRKAGSNGMFRKIISVKIPLPLSIFLLIILGVLTHLITKAVITHQFKEKNSEENSSIYNIRRMSGFRYIRPLLSAKPAQESELYSELKNSATEILAEYKDQGIITSGSVYMRDFEKGNWMSVNELERFTPGSILKLPVLITYLLMEEENPGLLEKKYTLDKKYENGVTQGIVVKSIEFGKSYTVKELIEYMILYSDNNANMILNEHMDFKKLVKIFNDLSIKAPDARADVYPMSARECSRFLEVLINATYLNLKNSEYAMSLLTRTQFKEGIEKGISEEGVLVAHKFGESGNNINRQLHETAIFYIKDKPYLLTIMTRGNDNVEIEKLSEVLQKVAQTVFHGLTNQ